MKKKLIVVADDFGFSEAYNYGVMKGYEHGIVTVLSLMSNMEAAAHAVKLASKHPEANLTQHTNYVQCYPCSDPKQIPSLVDENGKFWRSSQWAPCYPGDQKCRGTVIVTQQDAERELRSQLERFKELTGAYPNHFEGHSVGTPAINAAFRKVAEEMAIHCEALEEKETDRLLPAHELAMAVPGYMEILNRGARPEDFFSDAFQILESPFEINVLHFHPGYLDAYVLDNTSLTLPRCRDLQTLCDPRVRQWLDDHQIELTDFSAVYKKRR